MTIAYFAHDADGRIERTGYAPAASEVPAQVSEAHLTTRLGMANLRTDWWDGAALASRPLVPAPPSLSAGVAAEWVGVPDGSTLTVTDPETGVVAASEATTGTVSLTLPVGGWRIDVAPPFPTLPGSWLVDVET